MCSTIGEVVGLRTGPAGGRPNVAAMAMPRLQVIGGGKMGEALLGGWWPAAGPRPTSLRAVERLAGADELRQRFPGHGGDRRARYRPGARAGGQARRRRARLPGAGRGRRARAGALDRRRRHHHAAGGRTRTGTPVVRAMPNTPALVGAGAAAVAAGTAAGEAELAWAEQVLGAVGLVERVDEPLLDVVTGCRARGLPTCSWWPRRWSRPGSWRGARPVSTALATRTLLGAAPPARRVARGARGALRRRTSPGGTTAAGLGRSVGAWGSPLDAVMAATEGQPQGWARRRILPGTQGLPWAAEAQPHRPLARRLARHTRRA